MTRRNVVSYVLAVLICAVFTFSIGAQARCNTICKERKFGFWCNASMCREYKNPTCAMCDNVKSPGLTQCWDDGLLNTNQCRMHKSLMVDYWPLTGCETKCACRPGDVSVEGLSGYRGKMTSEELFFCNPES